MLLRHSAYYLIARGLPGLLNFAALAAFTRLLAPDDFGRYALILAGVGLANVAVFQWLRLVLARFLQPSRHELDRFLAEILGLFLVLALVITGSGILLGLVWPDPTWQTLLVLAVLLLITQAWFELNLTLAQAQLKPAWYGKLLGSKALLSLLVGAALAWLGLGAVAPLTGLLVAYVTASLLFALAAWRGISPRWPEAVVLREQLHYGLPLTVTFALTWVISGSDRLLLAWLVDEKTVGMYAAGYDLIFQALTLVLTIINTAAYPLAVDTLARRGGEAARKQLRQNGELIVAAALAGAAGLVVLGPQIITLLIGEDFREGVLAIFPWIALASALAGIKAYHFDIAFHLGRNTHWLVVTGAVAAVVNLALNLVLIPGYGILGAAWGTLGSYSVALISSAFLGRRVFDMPTAMPLILKGLAIAALTGFVAWLGTGLAEGVVPKLGAGLVFGLVGFLVICLVGNLGGLRCAAVQRLSGARAASEDT